MGTITHSEIKEKMMRHHDPSKILMDRHLTILRVKTDVSDNDTVFFKLDGYPPRGYGVFMQYRQTLILLTMRGVPYEEIYDIEEIIDDSPAPVGSE
jgi:hypothetical protein